MKRALLPLLIASIFLQIGCKKGPDIYDSDNPWRIRTTKFPQKAMITQANSERWMSYLPDKTPLTTISIPGTHNSGANYGDVNFVKCQRLTIADQLRIGVRFLDLRVSENLNIFHANYYQKTNLKDIFDNIDEFLSKNPNETIFVSIKEENVDNKVKFIENIFPFIMAQYHKGRIYRNGSYTLEDLENRNNYNETLRLFPDLGDVRGKVVLLRRFTYDNYPNLNKEQKILVNSFGISMDEWPNNNVSSAGQFSVNTNLFFQAAYVQDEYDPQESDSKNRKKAQAESMFRLSNNDEEIPSVLYINGLNLSNDGRVERYIPNTSKHMNEWMRTKTSEMNIANLGIILLDNIDPQTSISIINTN